MFSDQALITAVAGQVSTELDGEAAILHLESGIYFGLNEVGARVWQLVQQPRTVAEVRAAVLAEYEVTPEQWAGDLQTLLADLLAHKLIEVRDAPAA